MKLVCALSDRNQIAIHDSRHSQINYLKNPIFDQQQETRRYRRNAGTAMHCAQAVLNAGQRKASRRRFLATRWYRMGGASAHLRLEDTDDIGQVRSLFLHRAGGGGGLLDQRGVLLRCLVHLGDRRWHARFRS